MGTSIRINARIVSVQTAAVVSATAKTVPKTHDIEAIMGVSADEIMIGSSSASTNVGASPGVLFWTWYNLPPWSREDDSMPSYAGFTPSLQEYAAGWDRSNVSSPAKGIAAVYFLGIASGEIHIEAPGTYWIGFENGCGGKKLTIGSNTIEGNGADADMFFRSTGWYPFKMAVWYNGNCGAGRAQWRLRWRRPGDNEAVTISPAVIRSKQ
jgi:hypothetical protein